MNASEVARLTGVSVRTLHHYDETGLLCPARNVANGYREYTGADIATLQQILFFKECGFSLESIRALLESPSFDRKEAYELQRRALLHEKHRIDTMLQTIDASLRELKGETTMSTGEKFAGFEFGENPYEAEARERWGDDAVNRSQQYVAFLGKQGQKQLGESFDALFRSLAPLVGQDPRGEKAMEAMAEMFRYFNSSFGYTYTPEAFANLGRMYVDDTRFTKNIDKYATGLSAFLAEAMAAYAETLA